MLPAQKWLILQTYNSAFLINFANLQNCEAVRNFQQSQMCMGAAVQMYKTLVADREKKTWWANS